MELPFPVRATLSTSLFPTSACLFKYLPLPFALLVTRRPQLRHIINHQPALPTANQQKQQQTPTMSKSVAEPLSPRPPKRSTSSCSSSMVSDLLRRLKQQWPKDWSLRGVGVSSLLLLLLCSFFFYFFYLQHSVVPLRRGVEIVKGGILGGGSSSDQWGRCDLFEGKWVRDDSYPLYESRDCPFLDGGFRCSENGRPDGFYAKWRWQPKNCILPRFDAKDMLERLRNRRLAFVGDSIGRNQWESLLCLLSSALVNKSTIYEINGSPITKHNGFLVFKFSDYNCTIEYYRAPFLVLQGRPPKGVPKNVTTTLKLHQMDWMSSRWKDADLLVFNTGHWWNYEKTIRGGCYFQEGEDVKMEMSVEEAYKKSIETLVQWVEKVVNKTKTMVIYRTYSPVHFRGGDWKHGGSCHLDVIPELDLQQYRSRPWAPKLNTVKDVLSKHKEVKIDVLDVSDLTDSRKDGHASVYYLGPGKPASLHRQDCSHWCLPGVPDTWNELLYAMFLRRESRRSHCSNMLKNDKFL